MGIRTQLLLVTGKAYWSKNPEEHLVDAKNLGKELVIRLSTKDKPLRCFSCEKLMLETAIPSHIEEHKKQTAHFYTYECDYCKKIFRHRRSLTYHIRQQHLKDDTILKCPISIRVKQEPNQPMREDAQAEMKDYKCDTCGKSFAQKRYLQVHIDRHTDIRKYSCKFCERSYRDLKNLKSHVISYHTDNRLKLKYHCDLCDNRFGTKTMLITHIQKHLGFYNYKCTICLASFLNRSDMILHYKGKHKKDDFIRCNDCNKVFVNTSSLLKHQKFMHTKKSIKREPAATAATASPQSRGPMDMYLVKKYENI